MLWSCAVQVLCWLMSAMIIAPSTRGHIDGTRLREARWAAGLTQVQLCVRSGLAPRTIAYAENGHATRRTVEKIARALNVTPQVLAPGLVPQAQPSLPPLPPPAHEFQIR